VSGRAQDGCARANRGAGETSSNIAITKRPPHRKQRIEALPRSGSAQRDRAQTSSGPWRTSAGREGKPAGWPAPAV